MEDSVVYSFLKKILINDFKVKLRDNWKESNLTADMNLDSLTIVEIVMECEKEFKIKIKDDDILKLKTVSDIVNKIKEIKKD